MNVFALLYSQPYQIHGLTGGVQVLQKVVCLGLLTSIACHRQTDRQRERDGKAISIKRIVYNVMLAKTVNFFVPSTTPSNESEIFETFV